MIIKNPNNLPTVDYKKLVPLQGNLKDLTKKNEEKLKKILETDGFEVPIYIWKKSAKEFVIIDGHQRLRVLDKYKLDDKGSREVPYLIIEAADEAEAKRKLLQISSQFGRMTYEGLDEFMGQLPEGQLLENINFDALPLLGEDINQKPKGKEDGEMLFAIRIHFKNKEDLEEALPLIQDILEPYELRGINVNDGTGYD